MSALAALEIIESSDVALVLANVAAAVSRVYTEPLLLIWNRRLS